MAKLDRKIRRSGRVGDYYVSLDGYGHVWGIFLELLRWIGFFLLLAIISNTCGCAENPWPDVEVLGDQNNADEKRDEVLRAVEFFETHRGVYLREGLLIKIAAKPFERKACNGLCSGIYYHPYKIIIAWLGGTCTNALFHELLHREWMLTRDSSGRHNDPEFINAERNTRRAYCGA